MPHDLINDGRPFLGTQAPSDVISAGGLRAAIRDRRVQRLLRNVYCDTHASDSRDLRLQAVALLAPKDAIVAGDSVAWLHGVDTTDPADRFSLTPTVVVPNGKSRVRQHGVRVHEGTIEERDVVEIGGVRLLTPERATADMLRLKWRPNAMASADAMVRAGLVDRDSLALRIAGLRRRPGIRQARELVHLIDPRSVSWGESAMKLRLVDAGFPMPDLQHEVSDPRIGTRFLDSAYPKRLVAIEFDGKRDHTADSDVEYDLNRRSQLTALFGWRFVIAGRERLVGSDNGFELEVGELIDMVPLPRTW